MTVYVCTIESTNYYSYPKVVKVVATKEQAIEWASSNQTSREMYDYEEYEVEEE